MAYADVTDIESRWRTLAAGESTRAAALIDDASAMLDALVDVDEDDDEQAALLKMVCCNMVIRSLTATESDAFGVSNSSMTAGPYTQSFTYANPSGDMYLTRLERSLLGIGAAHVTTIRPMMAGDHDD